MTSNEDIIYYSHQFKDYCKQGNTHAVKNMIELINENKIEIDIHIKDDYALRKSCQYGHLEVVKLLLTSPKLKEHSNIHANSDEALKLACENGHLEVTKFLLTSPLLKVHSNSRKDQDVCLRMACLNGYLEVVELLCSFNPYFSQCHISSIHENIFEKLCENNCLETIQYIYNSAAILDSYTGKVKIKHNTNKEVYLYSQTAFEGLLSACENGHLELIQYLLIDLNFESLPEYKNKLPSLIKRTIDSTEDTFSIIQFLLTSEELKEKVDISIGDECFIRNACIAKKYDLVRYLTTSPELDKHSDISAPNIHYTDGFASEIEDAVFIRALKVKDMELLKLFIFELNFAYDDKKEHIIKHYKPNKKDTSILEEVEHMFEMKKCHDALSEDLKESSTSRSSSLKI